MKSTKELKGLALLLAFEEGLVEAHPWLHNKISWYQNSETEFSKDMSSGKLAGQRKARHRRGKCLLVDIVNEATRGKLPNVINGCQLWTETEPCWQEKAIRLPG